MPSGEAGNPLTPYFGEGHEEWVHGAPTALLPGPEHYKLELDPQRSP
jgi:penicillin amidase